MTPRALGLPIAAAVIVLAVAVWLLPSEETFAPASSSLERTASAAPSKANPEKTKRSPYVAPRSAIDATRPVITDETAPVRAIKPLDDDRSPLADELHAQDRTGMQDAAVVLDIFTAYRARFRGFPVGEDNAAFVRALAGHNPGRIALIPPNHPAIDAQGQLLDRWGKPFFFHLLDREAVEIRSSGPDHALYTPDDIVKNSPQAEAAISAINEN